MDRSAVVLPRSMKAQAEAAAVVGPGTVNFPVVGLWEALGRMAAVLPHPSLMTQPSIHAESRPS